MMPTVSRGALFRFRSSQNWFIKFYVDGRCQRETTGTSDRAEAQSFLARRIEEAARGVFQVRNDRITFAEMSERFLQNCAFKANRTDPSRFVRLEESDLQAILPHLPPHATNLVEFLYLTRWRVGEALRLQWSDVDWKRQSVWLRDSKNREPRVFPFKYHARLEQVLRRQRQFVSEWEQGGARLCTAVFPWRGRPMQKLRRSWKTACRAAGMPDRLVQDFRRTAVRNLIRAGVQQAIAMKITGHKTGSIFRRYLIVDEELLAQATGAVAEYLERAREEDQAPTT